MEKTVTIRAASEMYGVSARTLRFYEEAGILKSRRNPSSGYREYDAAQLNRLEIILLLRGLGFALREISGLMDGDARLRDVFQKKLNESDARLLELRETNRILHKLNVSLFKEPQAEISAADILNELVYLSKQTERMFPMKQSDDDSHVVLLGLNLAISLFNENGGEKGDDLVRKIKALRDENPDLPVIRIKDDSSLKPTEVVVIWDSKEVWRGECGTDSIKAAETIMEQIKSHS